MKKFAISIILTIVISGVQAQSPAGSSDRNKALQALQRAAIAYQQAKLLSFDVRYTYAREEKPAVIEDSLSGQYCLDGTRYWTKLANTESINDDNLQVTLFNEDSLLYVAKPTAANANPMSLLDSLMKNSNISFGYTETPQELVVTMSLPGAATWKKMVWYISRKTGYLNKMTSLVRSDQLYDASVRSQVTDAAAVYVVVETSYSHYATGAYTEKVFDVSQYVQKIGGQYVARAPYERYQVFLGSTGL